MNNQAVALLPLQRWTLLVMVGIGVLMVALDITILYTALPTLARDLHASSPQGLWIINAYPLVTAGLLLGAGTLGDRLGHRRMYLIGLVIFGLASLMAAMSATPVMLIAARIFQAVGAAAMMPATLALIRVAFQNERERNFAISVWACLSLVGAVLGPVLGGILLQHYWWGAIFLINLPVVVVAIVGTVLAAPSQTHLRGGVAHPWDWISSLQGLIALSSLVAAIKQFAASQSSWSAGVFLLALSVTAATLFIRRQSRLTYPLLDFSLFRNAAFSSGVLAAAFVTFAIGGLMLSIAQRFQWVDGFTPLQAGLLVATIFLGTLPSGLLGGAFLHKLGLRWLISGGLAVGGVGVLIAVLGQPLGMPWLIAGLVIAGIGLGATMSVASTAIMGNAPPQRAGMAASVEEVAYEFGSLFAVAILGSLLTSLYSATLQLPFDAPEAARQGIAEALQIAQLGGTAGDQLLEAATHAYEYAYQWVMMTSAGLLFVGALLTACLLNRYGPGTASAAAH
ncbi:MFS transporter [Pectobacterium brasiliense]|uniref:MFS transporter n=1 Tax=Pectobacterium brasiliense TaxID=180957 RepID=UPI001F385F7E|nr:MFS transporter [Pectobacterium brasiliense]